jgi:uncharacterized OB-fold protein
MNEQMITEGPVYSNNTGWVCPRCGASVAPDQKTCPNCKSSQSVVYTQQANSYTSCSWDCNDLNNNEQMICS